MTLRLCCDAADVAISSGCFYTLRLSEAPACSSSWLTVIIPFDAADQELHQASSSGSGTVAVVDRQPLEHLPAMVAVPAERLADVTAHFVLAGGRTHLA